MSTQGESVKQIALFGGTGFLGRVLISKLVHQGFQIFVFSRSPERHRDLTLHPKVSLHAFSEIKQLAKENKFKRISIMINLIGILNSFKGVGRTFEETHVTLTHTLFALAQSMNMTHFLQVSALGASPDAPSVYLQTKGRAQAWLLGQANEQLKVFIFQPSIIFGQGDSFFTRFAKLLKIAPFCFPLPCPNSVYTPVFVENVAECMGLSLVKEHKFKTVYQLCGPQQYTLLEIVRYCRTLIQKSVWICPLSPTLSHIQAWIMECLPGKPMSRDNYLSTLVPSVCTQPWPSWYTKELGEVEKIVPRYIN